MTSANHTDPGKAETPEQEGLYPIRHVCAETGINDVTLRAWERRYGLVRPQRTANGHRLYSASDIARIRRIRELLARGIPVSQVHRVLAREEQQPPARRPERPAAAPPEPGGPGVAPHTADPLAEALHTAAASLDVAELEQVYTRLVMRHGWRAVHETAFLGVYQRLRDEARHEAEGEARLAVFAAWATTAFADQLRTAIRACEGPPCPCLVLGGGHQQVGGMLLQLACARHGVATLPLFDATCPESLDILVWRLQAPAVILHAPARLLHGPEYPPVEAILGAAGPPCFLAGTAAAELAGQAHGRRVEVLPEPPMEAAERLARELSG